MTELNTPAHDLDLDDGATEIVDVAPSRKAPEPMEAAEIVRAPAGGRVARFTDAGRRDFLLLRKVGQPATRLALTQIHIFKALWTLWQAKRIAGADDPGVTITEISEAMTADGRETATSSISKALSSMTQNEMVRAVEVRAGFRFAAKRYYPSTAGVEAFALAEVLGDGSMVQVGRTARAWRRRDDSEPRNLFQHASLIRGWTDPADTVESA